MKIFRINALNSFFHNFILTLYICLLSSNVNNYLIIYIFYLFKFEHFDALYICVCVCAFVCVCLCVRL